MRVAVLDILDLPTRRWGEIPIKALLTKQYASVMPQAVSAWCRQLGHDVSHTAYYGVRSPTRSLPRDPDVLFVSCHSQGSALAYAIAKLYSTRGTLTVIGGPHAKSFPRDCTRFFDLVVTLKHYDPIEYYELLIEMFEHSATPRMLKLRRAATPNRKGRLLHRVRTLYVRSVMKTYRRILDQLKTDPDFHAFHCGQSKELPEFYQLEYERLLGRLAPLMSREDRTPNLEPIEELVVPRGDAVVAAT